MIDRSKDLDLQGEIDAPRISRNFVDKLARRAVTFLTEPAATNPTVAGLLKHNLCSHAFQAVLF